MLANIRRRPAAESFVDCVVLQWESQTYRVPYLPVMPTFLVRLVIFAVVCKYKNEDEDGALQ